MTTQSINPLWDDLQTIIQELRPEARKLMKSIHQHPEPSNEEYQTVSTFSGLLLEKGIHSRNKAG